MLDVYFMLLIGFIFSHGVNIPYPYNVGKYKKKVLEKKRKARFVEFALISQQVQIWDFFTVQILSLSFYLTQSSNIRYALRWICFEWNRHDIKRGPIWGPNIQLILTTFSKLLYARNRSRMTGDFKCIWWIYRFVLSKHMWLYRRKVDYKINVNC